jgi:cell division protein FtsN
MILLIALPLYASNSIENTQQINSLGKETVQKEANGKINPTNNIFEKTLITNENEVYRAIYTIQTGSFKNRTYAQSQFNYLVNLLDKKDLDYLRIERVNTSNVVRLGKFEDYSTAVKLIEEIKSHISNAFILETDIKNNNIMKLYK